MYKLFALLFLSQIGNVISQELLTDAEYQNKIINEQVQILTLFQKNQTNQELIQQDAGQGYQVFSQAFAGNKLRGFQMINNLGGRQFSDCGGQTLVGGYGVLGIKSGLRFLESLPGHQLLRMRAKIFKIDNWVGETFIITIDGKTFFKQNWDNNIGQRQHLCGQPDLIDSIVDIDIQIGHVSSSADIVFQILATQTPPTGSWGLREYKLETQNYL